MPYSIFLSSRVSLKADIAMSHCVSSPTALSGRVERFNWYSVKPKYTHIIEMMNMAGILHFNQFSAAEFINENYDNPTEWWNNDLVQEARLKYISKFARHSDNYTEIWADTINDEYSL